MSFSNFNPTYNLPVVVLVGRELTLAQSAMQDASLFHSQCLYVRIRV